MAKRKPNIVHLGIDSLLATHMSCYGYARQTTPHIDRFAAGATLFEQTFSPNVPTTSGYACMFSGMDVFSTQCVALRHQGPIRAGVRMLSEMLGEAGYETISVGFQGNPAARGFQKYLNYKESWGDLSHGSLHKAERLNDVALPELERLADSDRPFYLFLRHMDPHSPYMPPPPFDRLFYQGNAFDPANRSMQPVFDFLPFRDYFRTWMPPGLTDKDYVIAQYDGAVAYMDTCIQQIFEKLEALGLLDETIVVLNSDHGETLYDHDCYFDHHGLYDNTLKVPLVIRYPERFPAGRRVRGYNQHKDLVPTLLETAGIRVRAKFDGRSLLDLVDGEIPSFESEMYLTECTWMRKHGWRTPQWKYIHALEPDFHFKPEIELYDLIADPEELTNVAARHPDVVTLLEARMQAHIARRTKATRRSNPILNQPHWHGNKEIDYFTSSQQAYDTLHIGDPAQAQKLQAAAAAK
jgi:arylsulfatase A-like enzyme